MSNSDLDRVRTITRKAVDDQTVAEREFVDRWMAREGRSKKIHSAIMRTLSRPETAETFRGVNFHVLVGQTLGEVESFLNNPNADFDKVIANLRPFLEIAYQKLRG